MKVKNKTLYSITLIIVSSLIYAYTNFKRVENGYFTDAFWITINNTAYVLFWAVITGIVMAHLIPSKPKK